MSHEQTPRPLKRIRIPKINVRPETNAPVGSYHSIDIIGKSLKHECSRLYLLKVPLRSEQF